MYLRVSKQKRADGSQIAHLQFAESTWDPAKRRSQVRILYNFGRAEDPAVVEPKSSDVLHLHALKETLDGMLAREGRMELAKACFAFLPVRASLDLSGWAEEDIFAH